ncbi:MAG: YHYH protein [Myxococcota bacterium]
MVVNANQILCEFGVGRHGLCLLVLVAVSLVGCTDEPGASTSDDSTSSTPTTSTDGTAGADGTAGTETAGMDETAGTGELPSNGLDPDHFLAAGLAGPITEVDCTLSNGQQTTCYSIPITGAPADHDVGPFCPPTIDDGPEAGGVWVESGDVFDVDGDFIVGLAEFYDDPTWLLYDPETGEVRVTETEEACAAAAQPDVPDEYNNYCVECSMDYVDGGVVQDMIIPAQPVPVDSPGNIGVSGVGVALNGVNIAPPAPVDDILGNYTIAAFDDCGGHVNLAVGYHYHAAIGCPEQIEQDDGHAPLIGYAFDGYGIYAMVGADGVEEDDLDECRGQTDDVRGYHYHAASAGENMFIGCFHGATVDDGGGGGGGMDVIDCDDAAPGQPCCGDDICDGPETADNCAVDCG